MIKHLIFVSIFLLNSFSSYSQQTAAFTNDLVEFNKAIELYNNNQYLAAQSLFGK
ncbi:MAG: hypothetical protein ACI840_001724, partial [Ulvibacter sp.]